MKSFVEKKVIQTLPSGDSLNIKVYRFYGKGTKTIYIQSNIHGPELTGIMVIKKLIKYFKSEEGNFKELILVPTANPIGLNSQFIGQQTGYVNHLTGKNWNRIYFDASKDIDLKEKTTLSIYSKKLKSELEKKFKSAEEIEDKLGLTLQLLSFDADILIDLHTSWGKAPHYIYCYQDQKEKAKQFGIENIFFLNEKAYEGVFDESVLFPFVKNKKKIKNFKLPKQVFTVEFGADCSLDKENINTSFLEVLSYLSSEKLISQSSEKKKQTFTISLNSGFNYYYAPHGGLLVWNIKPGEVFKKGQILCEIHSLQTETVTFVKAQTPGKLVIQFNSHAVHEGQKICKVMSNFKTETSFNFITKYNGSSTI